MLVTQDFPRLCKSPSWPVANATTSLTGFQTTVIQSCIFWALHAHSPFLLQSSTPDWRCSYCSFLLFCQLLPFREHHSESSVAVLERKRSNQAPPYLHGHLICMIYIFAVGFITLDTFLTEASAYIQTRLIQHFIVVHPERNVTLEQRGGPVNRHLYWQLIAWLKIEKHDFLCTGSALSQLWLKVNSFWHCSPWKNVKGASHCPRKISFWEWTFW